MPHGVNWYAFAVAAMFGFSPLVLLYGGVGFTLNLVALFFTSLAALLLALFAAVRRSGVVRTSIGIAAGCFIGASALFSITALVGAVAASIYAVAMSTRNRRFLTVALPASVGTFVALAALALVAGSGDAIRGCIELAESARSLGTAPPAAVSVTPPVLFLRHCLPMLIIVLLLTVIYIYDPLPGIKPGRNFLNMFSRHQWIAVSMFFIPVILVSIFLPGFGWRSGQGMLPLLLALSLLIGLLLHKTVRGVRGRAAGTVVFTFLVTVLLSWWMYGWFINFVGVR
jgi:hypothetical protein